MSSQTINLTENLYLYLQKNSLREPKVLSDLRAETAQLTGAIMQISPEQGQFMMLLMELLGARKILDIGTYTGYSAICAALAIPSDGQVITCDVDTNNTQIAQKYFERADVSQKIQLEIRPAKETLQKLLDEGGANTFDFSFIDADKNNYDDYYEYSLRLLRRGGLIAIDNVLWSGKVADPTVYDEQTKTLRALNKKVLQDERVTISMLPIGDGLTLARKR